MADAGHWCWVRNLRRCETFDVSESVFSIARWAAESSFMSPCFSFGFKKRNIHVREMAPVDDGVCAGAGYLCARPKRFCQGGPVDVDCGCGH